MAQDLSHLQCTDVRRFRNSPTESHARFLHSFLSPRFSLTVLALPVCNPRLTVGVTLRLHFSSYPLSVKCLTFFVEKFVARPTVIYVYFRNFLMVSKT
jgi:hypothetical protein